MNCPRNIGRCILKSPTHNRQETAKRDVWCLRARLEGNKRRDKRCVEEDSERDVRSLSRLEGQIPLKMWLNLQGQRDGYVGPEK
jgi:hypothetical protein